MLQNQGSPSPHFPMDLPDGLGACVGRHAWDEVATVEGQQSFGPTAAWRVHGAWDALSGEDKMATIARLEDAGGRERVTSVKAIVAGVVEKLKLE